MIILQKKNIQPIIKSKQGELILSIRLGYGHKLFKNCTDAIFLLENPDVFINLVSLTDPELIHFIEPELTYFPLSVAIRILQIVSVVGTSEMSGKAKKILRNANLGHYIPKAAKRKHEEHYMMILFRKNPNLLKRCVQYYVDRLRKKPYQSRKETEKAVDDLFKDEFNRPMPLGFLNHLDNENYDMGLKVIALKIIAYKWGLRVSSLIHLWKKPEERRLRPHRFNLDLDSWEMLECLDALSQVVGLELLPEGVVIPHGNKNF